MCLKYLHWLVFSPKPPSLLLVVSIAFAIPPRPIGSKTFFSDPFNTQFSIAHTSLIVIWVG